MKSMLTVFLRTLSIPAVLLGCISVSFAGSSVEESDPEAARAEAMENPPALAHLRARQALIFERLHITAPMETQTATGVDSVAEAYRKGLIVPATLAEVEAAVAAAAATPSPEDDKLALELKHRGSYRFFVNSPSK